MYAFFVAIVILDAVILATAVLLQAGQGGGLATMGGGAGTETIMGGRQATTLLTKVTWWTAGIFLFLSLVLTFMTQSGTQVRSVLEGQGQGQARSEEHTSELQSRSDLVCRLLLEKRRAHV